MAIPGKTPVNPDEVRDSVRSYYGNLASSGGSCCGSPTEARETADSTALLYGPTLAAELPTEVRSLSAGCGNPLAAASLAPGDTVLDLGSGGGIDCFLAAQQVGEEGHVIGVDMTPAMLEKARANRERLGLANVEFRLGEIEHLPAADVSVDVVISNCVINLSPDKPRVLREAYRVLKPGGRLAISDILLDGQLPEEMLSDPQSWCACVSGALDAETYRSWLEAAGFEQIGIERIVFSAQAVDDLLAQGEPDLQTRAQAAREAGGALVLVDGEMKLVDASRGLPYSAQITARKPAG